MRLLVIEDDIDLQNQLKNALEHADFIVDVAGDGVEGLYYGKEYQYDLAIVDLGLPKMEGMEVIKQLRALGKVYPILILTARGGWKTKVQGLDIGADDYLVKPFQMEELQARIHALLRRAAGLAQSIIKRGPITLDLKNKRVQLAEAELDVTAFEYKILEYFMMHPDQIVSKSMLIDYLYAQDDEKDSNVIEVIIARLRKKLDPTGKNKPIETLRGRGYLFKIKEGPAP